MRLRIPTLFVMLGFMALIGTLLSGCGSGESEARSGSWMGLPSETVEGVGASVKIVTGSSVLGAGKSMPVVVYVTDRYGHAAPEDTSLTAGTKLGSKLDPDGSMEAKKGMFQCTVTAAQTTGVETLTFVSANAIGTATFQITAEAQPAPVVRVAPVADTVKVSGVLPVVVFVADANGIALDTDVKMFSLNGGTFADESGKSSGGVFLTEFTAPADQGVCWISAIVNGKTASTSVAVLP